MAGTGLAPGGSKHAAAVALALPPRQGQGKGKAAAGALLLLVLLSSSFWVSSLAHCPVGECMHNGNMPVTYKPFAAALTDEVLVRGAKCAAACTTTGYRFFSVDGNGICGCASTCVDSTVVHGVGYTGETYRCYTPPSGLYGTTACGNTASGKCPQTCSAIRNSNCTRVSTSTYKCCCSAARPNVVYYNLAIRGCSA